MTDLPDELGPGDVLTAAWLNQLVAALAASKITVAPDSGLIAYGSPGGTTIGVQETPAIWVKLTYVSSTAGSYSWIEQVPAAMGAWTNGFRKGFASDDPALAALSPRPPADPAWECNLNGTLSTGFVVLASRDAAVGRLSFRAGTCSS